MAQEFICSKGEAIMLSLHIYGVNTYAQTGHTSIDSY